MASTLISVFFYTLVFLTNFYSFCSRKTMRALICFVIEDLMSDVTQCNQCIANSPKVYDKIRFQNFIQFFLVFVVLFVNL